MARVLEQVVGDGHQDTAPLLKNGKTYPAVLSQIMDTTKRKYQSEETEPALRFVFTVSRANGEEIGTVSKKYKPSLNEKANLFKVVKAMIGKAPVGAFDVDTLIGMKCVVLVELWSTDQGIERNGIGNILPADDDDDVSPPPKNSVPVAHEAAF